jgi:hypothetical protein
MPDVTVTDLPPTNCSRKPAPASDAARTEIQRWEDDGGALPPEGKIPWHVERVERKK